MSKRLVTVNLALLVVCAVFVALMIRTARTPWPGPEPPRARPPAANPTAAPAAAEPPGAAGYAVIAARNLFSPTRSEAPPPPPTTTSPQAALPKPNLFGVVVRDGASVAYLEDPLTKRVAGYRQGDAIAGGTVQAISNDRVVLARPDGNVDVRLHDPSKPRPPAPVTPPAAGSARPTPGAPPATAPGAVPSPPQASGVAPGESPVPGRRPLPPNLLRRLPQSPTTPTPQTGPGGAPQQ